MNDNYNNLLPLRFSVSFFNPPPFISFFFYPREFHMFIMNFLFNKKMIFLTHRRQLFPHLGGRVGAGLGATQELRSTAMKLFKRSRRHQLALLQQFTGAVLEHVVGYICKVVKWRNYFEHDCYFAQICVLWDAGNGIAAADDVTKASTWTVADRMPIRDVILLLQGGASKILNLRY